jgi:hypothetical protein
MNERASLFPLVHRKLVAGTEVLRTGGGASLTAGECNAILDRVSDLEREHAEMYSLMKAAFDKRAAAAQETEDEHKRVLAFREVIWEHLIYLGDGGHTASGYGQGDIPDELLIDAVVDAHEETPADDWMPPELCGAPKAERACETETATKPCWCRPR